MFQPHAHAGLTHSVNDGSHGEPGRVILNVQALAHQVSRDRLDSAQRSQSALEDDHFFLTVHSLDPEHRFSVQGAGGTGLNGSGSRGRHDKFECTSRVLFFWGGTRRPIEPARRRKSSEKLPTSTSIS